MKNSLSSPLNWLEDHLTNQSPKQTDVGKQNGARTAFARTSKRCILINISTESVQPRGLVTPSLRKCALDFTQTLIKTGKITYFILLFLYCFFLRVIFRALWSQGISAREAYFNQCTRR